MSKLYKSWRDFPMAEWRWPNFSPEEIASNKIINAATGERVKSELMIDPRSMDMLQKLRTRLAKPMVVNSAYRSETYNAQIGGASNGFHPKAMAFDISMANHDPAAFEAAAIAVGFRGIGHYPGDNFMHIDTRTADKPVRFKGSGRNNAWFPKSAGGFTAVEPKPDTIIDVVKKPEVIGPIATGIGLAAPAVQGNGPVQFAIAIVLVAVAGFFIWRLTRPKEV